MSFKLLPFSGTILLIFGPISLHLHALYWFELEKKTEDKTIIDNGIK